MEHGSFRAYVSILYANPKMKIYIQGKRVHSKILMYTLYQPKTYVYTSNKFKNRAQVELTEMKKQLENSMDYFKIFLIKIKIISN